MKKFYVYILASRRDGFTYVGMTSDIARRSWEHRHGIYPGYSKDYNTKYLVYFETYDDFENAVKREKKLKKWRRQWKVDLIEKDNPEWKELNLNQ